MRFEIDHTIYVTVELKTPKSGYYLVVTVTLAVFSFKDDEPLEEYYLPTITHTLKFPKREHKFNTAATVFLDLYNFVENETTYVELSERSTEGTPNFEMYFESLAGFERLMKFLMDLYNEKILGDQLFPPLETIEDLN